MLHNNKRLMFGLMLSLVGCGLAKPEPPPPAPTKHAFTWSWRLIDASNPNRDKARLVGCAETGTAYVGLALRDKAGKITPFEWECTPTGDESTDPMPEGTYTIAAAALSSEGKKVLSSTTFAEDNVGGDKDLGVVSFPLYPR